jgi:hypothetical protein
VVLAGVEAGSIGRYMAGAEAVVLAVAAVGGVITTVELPAC